MNAEEFYSPAVLDDSPIAYLRLHSNPIGDIFNRATNVTSASIFSAGVVPTDFGMCISTGQSVTLGYSSLYNPSTINMTVEFWMKFISGTAVSDPTHNILSSLNAVGTAGYSFTHNANGIFAFTVGSSLSLTTVKLTISSSKLPWWNHIVGTVNNDTVALSINGTSNSTASNSNAYAPNTASDLVFGGASHVVCVDELAVYSTILSASRVAVHERVTNPPTQLAADLENSDIAASDVYGLVGSEANFTRANSSDEQMLLGYRVYFATGPLESDRENCTSCAGAPLTYYISSSNLSNIDMSFVLDMRPDSPTYCNCNYSYLQLVTFNYNGESSDMVVRALEDRGKVGFLIFAF
jgi:hypothetical protein